MRKKRHNNGMRFRIIVNRWANFFFFVNNLSGWHFSTIKPYNDYWLTRLGGINATEQKALAQFANLQRRWPRKEREISDFFFNERDPFAALAKTIPVGKQRVLQEVFTVFKKKFDRLYAVEFSSLRNWQKTLRASLGTKRRNEEIVRSLTVLHGPPCRACTRPVPLYLLVSAPGGIGGSADVDGFRITAEVSQSPRSPRGELPHILGTIWHEVIHLCFDKQRFRPILERLYPKDGRTVRRINEVVAATLFPAGILGKRFLNIPLQLPTRSLASPQNAQKILELSSLYLQKKRQFDEQFVQRTRELLDTLK